MIKKYRKKPLVIEAMQFTPKNREQVFRFIYSDLSEDAVAGFLVMNLPLVIETLEGDMTVNYGDYVIKGIQGEFYPCKPDIFLETYEDF